MKTPFMFAGSCTICRAGGWLVPVIPFNVQGVPFFSIFPAAMLIIADKSVHRPSPLQYLGFLIFMTFIIPNIHSESPHTALVHLFSTFTFFEEKGPSFPGLTPARCES